MTRHHLINSDLLTSTCLYCGGNLMETDWKSDHALQKHYKINKCRFCGREAKILMDFDGDGIDSWSTQAEDKPGGSMRVVNILGQPKNLEEKDTDIKSKKLENML